MGIDHVAGRWTGRDFIWFVAAMVVVLAAVAMALSTREGSDGVRAERFEYAFPDDYVGTVWFTLVEGRRRDREVTATWGRLQRRFLHRGRGPTTYLVTKGAGKERSGPLVVEVEPGLDVIFGFGEPPDGAVDLSSVPWTALPYGAGVEQPRPATVDAPEAAAAVDESVSYGGVDPAGVGVRPEPTLRVDRIGVVRHGEVVAVRCWRTGDRLTNGNDADPADDAAAYTSDVWWLVEYAGGEGYVPDVWLARRGGSDRLGLAACA